MFSYLVFLSSALEKEMATHSSILAWKIPWTEEPGRLQSMGSLRVGHDCVTSLSFFLLGLHCYTGFSLAAESGDHSLVVVHRLLSAVTSLVVEHGL